MHFLAKIGKQDDLLQLQQQGVVFCNTVKYFAKLENDGARGDKFENVTNIWTPKKPTLSIKPSGAKLDDFKQVNVSSAQVIERQSDPLGNLFCLYTIEIPNSQKEGQISVDDKNGRFGNYVLVFSDTPEFQARLFKELNRRNLKFYFGLVDYIDLKSHTGRKSLFQKDLEYSYQNEYRIFIENSCQDALKVEIGSISDISTLYTFDEFRNLEYYQG